MCRQCRWYKLKQFCVTQIHLIWLTHCLPISHSAFHGIDRGRVRWWLTSVVTQHERYCVSSHRNLRSWCLMFRSSGGSKGDRELFFRANIVLEITFYIQWHLLNICSQLLCSVLSYQLFLWEHPFCLACNKSYRIIRHVFHDGKQSL